jgi:hypothetical protein
MPVRPVLLCLLADCWTLTMHASSPTNAQFTQNVHFSPLPSASAARRAWSRGWNARNAIRRLHRSAFCPLGNPGEILKDHTVRTWPAGARRVATGHERGDAALECPQLIQLSPHCCEVLLGQVSRLHARTRAVLRECNQRFHCSIENPRALFSWLVAVRADGRNGSRSALSPTSSRRQVCTSLLTHRRDHMQAKI